MERIIITSSKIDMRIVTENIAINRKAKLNDILYELGFLLSRITALAEVDGETDKKHTHTIQIKNGKNNIASTLHILLEENFREEVAKVRQTQKPQ